MISINSKVLLQQKFDYYSDEWPLQGGDYSDEVLYTDEVLNTEDDIIHLFYYPNFDSSSHSFNELTYSDYLTSTNYGSATYNNSFTSQFSKSLEVHPL